MLAVFSLLYFKLRDGFCVLLFMHRAQDVGLGPGHEIINELRYILTGNDLTLVIFLLLKHYDMLETLGVAGQVTVCRLGRHDGLSLGEVAEDRLGLLWGIMLGLSFVIRPLLLPSDF
jgi:hypothetical protein